MLSICSWTSLPALPFGAMVIPATKYRTQSVSNRKGPIKITVFNSLLLTEPPTTKPKSNHLLSGEPFPNVQPELSWCSFNPFSCAHDLDFSIEPCSRFAQSLRERIVFHHWIVHHQREQKMNKQRAENGSLFRMDWRYRKLLGKQHFPLWFLWACYKISTPRAADLFHWLRRDFPTSQVGTQTYTHSSSCIEEIEMQEANQDNKEHLPRRLVLAWWPRLSAKIQALPINNSFSRWTSPG